MVSLLFLFVFVITGFHARLLTQLRHTKNLDPSELNSAR